jgi:hypothetical protein
MYITLNKLSVVVLVLASCSSNKIEISPEYILNENWTKKNETAWANTITIQKMKEKKDSIIDPYSKLSNATILQNLEEDTSFMHFANLRIEGENYKTTKIYFNRFNGFYWGSKSRNNSTDSSQTIGNLQQRNWYRFSDLGLGSRSFIFVYVDSSNNVHRFDIDLSNY